MRESPAIRRGIGRQQRRVEAALGGISAREARASVITSSPARPVIRSAGLRVPACYTGLPSRGPNSSWADLGELGLCRSRLQRRRMLRLVDAEFPAAWQRKPRDRAPALLVDGRALHVLLLHLGDERLHVVAH